MSPVRTSRWGRLVIALVVGLPLALLPTSTAWGWSPGQTLVSLTFNDGMLSQYNNAGPVLKSHAINGSFFVASSYMDKSFSCCMAWWQLDDMYRDGNEIGGMGLDHKDLTAVYNTDSTQDYAYKKQQACNDRQRLVQLGYDPRSFAYPRGAYKYTFADGSTVEGIVKDCGYLSGRAVGGLSTAGPAYAETVPAKDAYAVRTPSNTATGAIQLADLQASVNAAASHGGGWVPLVFNEVCRSTDANYSTCMGTSKPIDDKVFSSFLDWLQKTGQTGGAPANTSVQTVRQVMGAPPQPVLPPRPVKVSLTFDDGDASQYRTRPILSSHAMHGTFYVSSSNKTVTWAQVSGLAVDGNEIGGHTLHHIDLTSTSYTYDQKVKEVCDDRQTLIQQGYAALSFAYPFGSYDATAESIVKSCGYQSGRRAGGLNPAGPVYAETTPPADSYTVRTVYRAATDEIRLAELTNAVTAAANHGGGWVVLVFHEICSSSSSDYATCMGSYKPVQDTTFTAFLDWLKNTPPPNTSVKTVAEVMSGK
jgi:peptidoglycan/xylan/chitin deacetylase (PgdA/CDA1 family)